MGGGTRGGFASAAIEGFDQYNVKQWSWCEVPVRLIGCDGM